MFWGVKSETGSCGLSAAVANKWSLYREDEADLREIINHEENLSLFVRWGRQKVDGDGDSELFLKLMD